MHWVTLLKVSAVVASPGHTLPLTISLYKMANQWTVGKDLPGPSIKLREHQAILCTPSFTQFMGLCLVRQPIRNKDRRVTEGHHVDALSHTLRSPRMK